MIASMKDNHDHSKHRNVSIGHCADGSVTYLRERYSREQLKFYFYSGIDMGMVEDADLCVLIADNQLILSSRISCIINHKFPGGVETEQEMLECFLIAVRQRIEAL